MKKIYWVFIEFDRVNSDDPGERLWIYDKNMCSAKILWSWHTSVGWDGQGAYRIVCKVSIPEIIIYWKGHDNKAWWERPIKF